MSVVNALLLLWLIREVRSLRKVKLRFTVEREDAPIVFPPQHLVS